MKTHSEIEALIKSAVESFDALSPAEQDEHRRQQKISWVYGNLVLDNENIIRDMVERAMSMGDEE